MSALPPALRARLSFAGFIFLVVVVAVGPCALALDPQNRFFVDWHNSLWMINQHAAALRVSTVPVFFHTTSLAGIPTPAFYGHLFYPVLGGIAIVTGAATAVALAIAAAAAGQAWLWLKCFRLLGARKYPALAYTTLITWTVYPMTCLYSRSALPEYFAMMLVLGAAAALMIARRANSARAGIWWLQFSLWLVTAAAGTHLITAVYGSLTFLGMAVLLPGPLVPAAARQARGRLGWSWVGAVLVLAPLAYLLAAYSSRIAISGGLDGHVFLIPQIDSLTNRLAPFPEVPPGSPVSTPALDTHINVPLLFFVAVALVAAGRSGPAPRRALALFGLGVALLVISSEQAPAFLQVPFYHAQFAYRLVGYVNLLLAAALLAWVAAGGRTGAPLAVALGLAVLWAVVIVGRKHERTLSRLRLPGPPPPATERIFELPATFYGAYDYAVINPPAPWTFAGLQPVLTIRFLPSAATLTGKFPAVDLVAPAGGALVATNLLSFPWNHLWRNGQPVDPADLSVADFRSVIRVPGGPQRIEYRPQAPVVWVWLRRLSFAVMALSGGGLLFGWFRARAGVLPPTR